MIDKYDEAGIPTGVLEHTETANMAMTGNATAKPMEKCKYPLCEECACYVGHYCTVPIVISKQNYIIINDKIDDLMKRTLDLEILVYDELLRPKPQITTSPAETNYTWADYFGEDQ